MTSFRIVEHKVPAQHIREYRQATANSQEDVLYLSVKQYIPLENPDSKPGDVTIIGAHANGFPKELYEPLWDDLLKHSRKQGWRIRSIWIADVAHQGWSGIVNETLLGNDPSWHDHSRDLLHLINLKRDEMPRPIVGIGHSMGGAQLVYLSLMHPRLISSLILLDPTIGVQAAGADPRMPSPARSMAQLSTFRRDIWPSRESAIAAFDKSVFKKTWDDRVYQKWLDFGLREVPTVLYPEAERPQVTLATTVAQEVFTYVRPNYDKHGADGNSMDRTTHPDVDHIRGLDYPFYRPESPHIFRRLPELRPSVLYIFGGISPISTPKINEERLAATGTGIGGSGGPPEGKVKGATLEGIGHLVAMEATIQTAAVSAEWIGYEMSCTLEEEQRWQKEWGSKSLKEKQEIDDVWKGRIGGAPKRAKI